MQLFKYREIFRVSVTHGYYKNGLSQDLIFEPSEYTRQLLRNHNLQIKTLPYGFAVFGEVETVPAGDQLLKGFGDDAKFTFLVKLKNPYFLNFTDLPVKLEPHTIYYFNNLQDFEAGGELRLADINEIPKLISNSSQLTMVGESYQYNHTSTDPNKTGILTYLDEGFSIEETLDNNNDAYHFQFNLSKYNPGRCEFTVDGVSEKFYAGSNIYKQDVFGIAEIFVKNTVPVNYQIVDSSNIVTPKHYTVPFLNRSTLWRYLVYDKMTNTLTGPQISMVGTDFAITSSPAASYPDDYALHTFISGEDGSPSTEKALPLQEEPLLPITLSGTINSTAKDIIENLPNPNISLIKPDSADPGKIYSDIIVYV